MKILWGDEGILKKMNLIKDVTISPAKRYTRLEEWTAHLEFFMSVTNLIDLRLIHWEETAYIQLVSI